MKDLPVRGLESSVDLLRRGAAVTRRSRTT